MKMQTAQLQRAFRPDEIELTHLNGPRVSLKVRIYDYFIARLMSILN